MKGCTVERQCPAPEPRTLHCHIPHHPTGGLGAERYAGRGFELTLPVAAEKSHIPSSQLLCKAAQPRPSCSRWSLTHQRTDKRASPPARPGARG